MQAKLPSDSLKLIRGSASHSECSSPSRPHLAPKLSATSSTTLVVLSSPSDTMELGKSGLQVPVIGVGTWSWGDRSGYWGYGTEYGKEQSREAFKALVKAGLTFVDTAEFYGFGKCEEFLGEFLQELGPGARDQVQVATKFAPLPWRLTAASVPTALKASLARMRRTRTELYMQHWPGFALNAFANNAYLDGLIQCKEQNLCDALGVSNFNAQRIEGAAKRLGQAGIPLATNQMQYSLLYRTPENTGVLEACREHGVTLVAYSPLAQGLLTGKYMPGGQVKPYGVRAPLFNDSRLREVQPLLGAMKAVADERGKTMAQVAINWCICKGTLPIPGAKNDKQLHELAGSVGWRLSDGEVSELDMQSGKVSTSMGAPFEDL